MHWLDLTIMLVYIAGCMAAGIAAAGRKQTAQDYFTASGALSGWFSTIVVGISIAGTYFSGISFIAYPSVTYSDGIGLYVGAIFFCMPLTYVVMRYWFLPRYLSSGCVYPYDIIERRFGALTRTTAAALFVLVRVGWMAAMIYAPTIAIMAMGRLEPKWFWPIVLVTGLTNTIYTVISGVRGVIVTEAIQMTVIAIGIGSTVVFAAANLPVPFDVGWADLRDAGRLEWLSLTLEPTAEITTLSVLIGVTVNNLANYAGDQMALQRYLATGEVRAAGRSFFVNLVGVLVVCTLLASVGLLLFAFYSHTSDPTLPEKADRIFPHFVATRLPVGVAGLVLAALLAATSIPSGINALAATVTLDFRIRLGSRLTEAQQLRFAKVVSLIIGVAATLVAGVVERLGRIFTITQILLGVFAGPLLVCVLLSVTRLRIAGWAMTAGMLAGCATGIALAQLGWGSLWISPSGAAVTFVVAAAGSIRERRKGRFERTGAVETRETGAMLQAESPTRLGANRVN
jgi:SSS family solute:Na+ symporter